MNFINRYCHIRNRSLIDQGKVVYASPEGTLDDFLTAAFFHLSPAYPKYHKMDRLSKLGFLASEILLKAVSLLTRYQPAQVAIVLSNAHASLDTDVRYFESIKTMASPALFVYTLPNIVVGEICIRQHLQGENAFFVSEEFDANLMADYIKLVMASEKTQACIAGWVEVMGDHHDVFLYLVEKWKGDQGVEHSAKQLQKFYSLNYGTIDDETETADY